MAKRSEKERLKELTIMGKKLNVRALALAAFILVFVWAVFMKKDNHVELGVDDRIGITPTQIESIKSIGEWVFLSVSDEELIDTVRKGLFSDDQLVRIYYGTLEIGINMHQVKPGWISGRGDSVTVTLPKVGLLDNDFIDEARTKAFFESGTWKAADREAMYKRAYAKMKAHCLTPENLKIAQDNADAQFRKMMRSMGYNHIIIRFED